MCDKDLCQSFDGLELRSSRNTCYLPRSCHSSRKLGAVWCAQPYSTSYSSSCRSVGFCSTILLACCMMFIQRCVVCRQVLHAPPNPAIRVPTGGPTQRAELERTRVVWMFVGGTPSITRTSPTPPPAFHPARRVLRRPLHLTRAHDPRGLPPPERRRPCHSRRRTVPGTGSEQGNGGDPDSEGEEEVEDNDDDSWTPGVTAEPYEVSSEIAAPTGSVVS